MARNIPDCYGNGSSAPAHGFWTAQAETDNRAGRRAAKRNKKLAKPLGE